MQAGRIDNPLLEAEILLSAILKKPYEFILTHAERKITKAQAIKYQRLLKRRFKGEPIAYLTGHKEFYGLNFMVNKNVLIPRPETELMIEEALKLVAGGSPRATIIDIGTGSGCVIITLAKMLNHNFTAIDISPQVLTVAKKNAKAHGVNKKIKFIQGDLLRPMIKKIKSPFIILANLPYGWPAWKNNCSLNTVGLKFEPKIAIFTDKQGLGLYEKLFKQIKAFIPQSAIGHVLCEFDPRQTVKIKRLIKRELPDSSYQIKKDLSGLNRLAIITLPAH